jgi:hypothetical protein
MNSGNVSSGAVNFTIVAPAPAAPPAPAPIVSRLNPGGVRAGGGAFTLTVAGSGFQPASVVNWNRTPLATQFVNPSTLAAAVPESLIAAAGTASITVVNPGNVTSGSLSLTVFSRQISLNDRDAELLKSVLAEYAAAYSQKDFRRVTALFPQMSKEDRKSLQEAFSRNDYRVQFTIEPTSQPVFKGDDATINARTVIVTQAGRQVNPAVSRNVVISLHKNNGQWTISAFR